MKVLAMILLLCSLLTAFWTILGLIRPKLVLWWALPEKQTRGHAALYALWLTGVLFLGVYCLAPISPWWTWGIFGIVAFFLLGHHELLKSSTLHTPDKKSVPVSDEALDDDPEFQLDEAGLYNMPEFPFAHGKTTKVPSFRSDDWYTVDTQRLTCSCPDWLDVRFQYDPPDPRRLCKHLIHELTMQKFDLQSLYGEGAAQTIFEMYLAERGFPKKAHQTYKIDNSEWKYEWKDELKAFFQKKLPAEDERQIRELFGGDEECLYNFRMYIARYMRGMTVCHVPPEDHYRRRFDVLARTGIAQKSIANLEQILPILTMEQLKNMADAVQCKKAKSKQKQCELLLACSEADVKGALPAVEIDVNNIFTLTAINIK